MKLTELEITEICARNGLIINPATLKLLEKEGIVLTTIVKAEKVFCPIKGEEILPEEHARIICQCLDKRCGICGQILARRELDLQKLVLREKPLEIALIQSCINVENIGYRAKK